MLYMSQEEINYFYNSVIEDVAKSLNIKKDLFESVFELGILIDESNKIVAEKLSYFIQEYQAWYDVHVEIDKAGTSGNLTPEQSALLNAAITKRDAARNELKESLL